MLFGSPYLAISVGGSVGYGAGMHACAVILPVNGAAVFACAANRLVNGASAFACAANILANKMAVLACAANMLMNKTTVFACAAVLHVNKMAVQAEIPLPGTPPAGGDPENAGNTGEMRMVGVHG